MNIKQEINQVSEEIIALVNNIEQEKDCIMVLDQYVEMLKSIDAYNEKYGLDYKYNAELEKFLNEILR